MNVFIDTNLYLDFYRMGKDKLDELEKAFALHHYGHITLWVPELLKNEFWRNRSKVVADNIKEIEKDYKPSMPHIFRQHEKLDEFSDSINTTNRLKNEILRSIQQDFKDETLDADEAIKKIFENARIIRARPLMIKRGKRRFDLGNPPGKNKSYGDAVNWECLLDAIPDGEDIYLITEDSDYKSAFIKDEMNEYMKHEWKTKKESEPHMYSRISEFIKEHFPQATNLAEMEVNLTIDELEESGSFASTHRIVEKLLKFDRFTQPQLERLIRCYFENDQVGYIRTDSDVKRLGRKIILEFDEDKGSDMIEPFTMYIEGP